MREKQKGGFFKKSRWVANIRHTADGDQYIRKERYKMKKVTIKVLGIVLIFAMMFSLSATAFAANSPVDTGDHAARVLSNHYTVDDVKALEPYVYVEDGCFRIDVGRAVADGFETELVYSQSRFFEELNKAAKQGKIVIHENLDFTTTSPDRESASYTPYSGGSRHWHDCGGGRNTSVTNHWWGYSRYACDCETRRMMADFNSCASVAAGVAVVGAYFGPIGAIPGGLSSAYWWLLASRLDANNHGKGVYIEMTWVLAFDITPQ